MSKIKFPLLLASLILIASKVSAEWQVSPELHAGIQSHYDLAIKQLLEDDSVPQQQKQNILQSELNNYVVCVLHREYLHEQNPSESRFVDEKSGLSGHLSVVLTAMERNGLAKKEKLEKQITRDSPMLMSQIKKIYARNANSGLDQATEEVHQLASMCLRKAESIREVERGVKSKL